MRHKEGVLPGQRSVTVASFLILLVLMWMLASPSPAVAGIETLDTCLSPCHVAPGFMGPDVESAYMSAGQNAGHSMDWNPKVVLDTSGATLPQGSRMPCDECHSVHGSGTSSIYMFSTARTGGVPITTVREMCEGCHVPSDSLAEPATVCGVVMKRLPASTPDHTQGSVRPCSDCHGPSAHMPAGHGGAGGSCGDAGCHGDSGSHAIHLSATDARGPGALACSDCHQADAAPYFASGTDSDLSGRIELDETDVCDECHSPGGSYDGVDSALGASGAMSVGAKDNWPTKVYATANSLRPGAERWCAGCHDGDDGVTGEEPSLVSGVYAPPVAGDESAPYIYGTGWGFYKTGHGAPSSAPIPSNAYDPGPGLECDDCHDYLQTHIDGERRTFTQLSDNYRTGYRLDMVGGTDPMDIPRTDWFQEVIDFKLCFECHPSDNYLNLANLNTNFKSDGLGQNMHAYHTLGAGALKNRWDSDWDGAGNDSYMSCPTCHNVHGSTYMAMIQDGSLISDTVERRPGLRIWYWDNAISVWNEGNPDPPIPEDITMAMSDGWVWRGATASNICVPCHGNNNTVDFPRVLWKSFGVAPILSWFGAPGYVSDGANPDSGSAAETFTFRIVYSDGNNEAPVFINLLIDRNDDGDYGDAGEVVAMTADTPADTTYYNGNGYSTNLQLAKAGDNVLDYRFEASDGVSGVSTTPTRTITVTNAPPTLPWTGEVGYTTDGVSPNSGTTGITNYEFRITYRDADGEGPGGGAPLLYVDKNDDGDFGDAGEIVTLADMGDPSVVTGKRFNHTTTLLYGVDGLVPYYFEASDGYDTTRSGAGTVTVLENINQAPVLDWTGEPGYVNDGTDPESQAASKPFYFRVKYTDANNDAPGVAQVWVDLDDDLVYEPGEKFVMNDSVTSTNTNLIDGDYSNGEIFAEAVPIQYAGDGTLNYCFHFEDANAAEATGVHETDRTLSVYAALDVPSEYATIQLAVNAATTGDTVLVADGTYAGFAYNNKDIFVESVNGPATTFIQQPGGYAVDFNYYSGNSSNSTIRGFTIQNSSRGVMSNMSDVVIDDCVFTGNAYGVFHQSSGAYPIVVTDSQFNNNTTAAIVNMNNTAVVGVFDCGFNGNTGTTGPAMNIAGGVWTAERCSFDGNTATGAGGAIWANGITNLHVVDSVFTDNTAGGDGGAINFVGNGSATDVWLTGCEFRGNDAANGGALYVRDGDYDLTNCLISGNYATGEGGGVRTNVGRPVFTNCTIAGNSGNTGGGIYAVNNTTSQPDVYNCIVWGNESRSTSNEEIESNNLARVEVRYTDINQAYTGFFNQAGNMTANPLFASPVAATSAPTTSGDYHISDGSPVEGQASSTYAPDNDIDGDSRPQNSGDDMGSDEYVTPPPTMDSGPSRARTASPPTSPQPHSAPFDPLGIQTDPSKPTVFTNRESNAVSSDTEITKEQKKQSKRKKGVPVPVSVPAGIGAASLAGLGLRELLRLRG